MPFVLFEDNHLLVVNKPAGLLTQPALENDSLETRAKAYIKSSCNKPGEVFLHAVHRIDRVTSGIIVFARTSKALARLNQSIRDGEWKKKYLACAQIKSECQLDLNEHATYALEDYLQKKEHQTCIVNSQAKGAKKAKLFYRCVNVTQDRAALEIELETGRYHQIRAQLSSRGAPILGDVKYGANRCHTQAIALHHYKLKFMHPVKRREIQVQASIETNPYAELKLALG